MTLGRLLSDIVDVLASVNQELAIAVLKQLNLKPAIFEECYGRLVCSWIEQEVAPSDNLKRKSKFSWFKHLKSESAGVIRKQLDVVTLSDLEQAEIKITILFRVRLLSSQGKKEKAEVDSLAELLDDYYSDEVD